VTFHRVRSLEVLHKIQTACFPAISIDRWGQPYLFGDEIQSATESLFLFQQKGRSIDLAMSLKRSQSPDDLELSSEPPQKRRRSSAPLSDPAATPTTLRESYDHELGAKEHNERRCTRDHGRDNITASASSARLTSQAVAPFLTRHIPNQYAPLGNANVENTNAPKDPNSKFCYRHRPDMLCRRQADEPSMDKLQKVRANPQTTTSLS
jgi:hypothetical protein